MLVVGKKHLSWVSMATVQGACFIVFKLLHYGVFSHSWLLLAQSWLCWHQDQPSLGTRTTSCLSLLMCLLSHAASTSRFSVERAPCPCIADMQLTLLYSGDFKSTLSRSHTAPNIKSGVTHSVQQISVKPDFINLSLGSKTDIE